MTTVRELMSAPPVTCRVNDSLNDAADLMWAHDCGALPVVDDDGKLAAMVTDRDICMAAYMKGAPLGVIRVSEAMSKSAFSCTPNVSLEEAEQLMSEKQVRRVPVIDGDNRPIGMLSMNDIARHAAGTRKKNGLEREVTQTLAAICQPRTHPETSSYTRAQPPP